MTSPKTERNTPARLSPGGRHVRPGPSLGWTIGAVSLVPVLGRHPGGIAVHFTAARVAIFVGTASLRGPVASAFTTGLHAAFYESVSFMVIAAILSALRGGVKKTG